MMVEELLSCTQRMAHHPAYLVSSKDAFTSPRRMGYEGAESCAISAWQCMRVRRFECETQPYASERCALRAIGHSVHTAVQANTSYNSGNFCRIRSVSTSDLNAKVHNTLCEIIDGYLGNDWR